MHGHSTSDLEPRCEVTTWKGRDACRLANDVIELTHLTGGGCIADIHLHDGNEINPYWTPRWKTMEPFHFDPARHTQTYGPPEVGRLLCGIAGHSLCLDLFGAPSEEEAAQGGTLHGEAGISKWKASFSSSHSQSKLRFSVRLPRAAMQFARSLLVRRGEPIVYVRETVKNLQAVDRFFQWQQHVTFGPPFLSKDCFVALPGGRGMTHPEGYEGREWLKSSSRFTWPNAGRSHGGRVDLQQALTNTGRGFVAGVQILPQRADAFFCVSNLRSRLAVGYCFRREDFPWICTWEENAARRTPPWNGREKTRAIEFGASPLPLSRADGQQLGPLFGSPTLAYIPAKMSREIRYVIFLAKLPAGSEAVRDVRIAGAEINLLGGRGEVITSVPATHAGAGG